MNWDQAPLSGNILLSNETIKVTGIPAIDIREGLLPSAYQSVDRLSQVINKGGAYGSCDEAALKEGASVLRNRSVRPSLSMSHSGRV